MKDLKFKCAICGEEHVNEFSFSFNAPLHYESLSDEEKAKSKISSDLCVIENDFFIRAILEIPILDSTATFLWGVWVSQSEDNFKYYTEHFTDDLTGRTTFGWFCNSIPEYEDTIGLKTIVHFQGKGSRPKIEIQETQHKLYYDFCNGITLDQANEIAQKLLHK